MHASRYRAMIVAVARGCPNDRREIYDFNFVWLDVIISGLYIYRLTVTILGHRLEYDVSRYILWVPQFAHHQVAACQVNGGACQLNRVTYLWLGNWVVNINGGKFERFFLHHFVKIMNSSCRLLRDSFTPFQVFRIFFMDQVGQVATIV